MVNRQAVADFGLTELDDELDQRERVEPASEFAFYDGNPHAAAVRAPVSEMAAYLEDLLSRRLTAYAVGVRDVKTIGRWAQSDVDSVRSDDVERRLRALYHVALLLRTVDAPSTVKAWFVGANPDLEYVSPLEMIRQGADREVLGAAQSFVVNA